MRDQIYVTKDKLAARLDCVVGVEVGGAGGGCSRDFEFLNKKNAGVKVRVGRMAASERKIQED